MSRFLQNEVIGLLRGKKLRFSTHGGQFRLLVVGETHYIEEQIVTELQLINLVRPRIVLHEMLGALVYDPSSRVKRLVRQPDRAFHPVLDPPNLFLEGLIQGFVWQAEDLGHLLVGIDLTHMDLVIAAFNLVREKPEEFSWEQWGDRIEDGTLRKVSNPSWTLTRTDRISMAWRNRHMVHMIMKYEKESQEPLVVIVGNSHMGPICQSLTERGLGYVAVHLPAVG